MSVDAQLKKAALDLHNKHRKNHQVDPLQWDDECYRLAKTWAEQLGSTLRIAHGGKPDNMGQNIFYSSAKNEGVAEAVQAWMAEEAQYDYSKPDFATATGHFTQCVWKGTQKIGLAAVPAKGGGVMIVANYTPQGNVRTLFSKNVNRPLQAVKYVPNNISKGPGSPMTTTNANAGVVTKHGIVSSSSTGTTNSDVRGTTQTSVSTKTKIINGKSTTVTTTTMTHPDGTKTVVVDPPEAAASASASASASPTAARGLSPKKTTGTTKTSISKKTSVVNGVKKTMVTKKTTHPDGRVTESVTYE